MLGEAKIGDIKYGHEVGKKEHGGKPKKYILIACIDCGKQRWAQLKKLLPLRCNSCICKRASRAGRRNGRGEKCWNWKGGRHKSGAYYIVWVEKDNFFFSMARFSHRSGNSGYIAEHRLVMAEHLGRCLHRWEIVHHKNGIKTDNRIENLQLVTDDRHKQITMLETRIAQLEKRITIIEAENTLLRAQLPSIIQEV